MGKSTNSESRDTKSSSIVLLFHYHSHCPQVTKPAVLGINVPQHCLSGQCSGVSSVFVEVLRNVQDALFVSAGKTGKSDAAIVSTDSVRHS